MEGFTQQTTAMQDQIDRLTAKQPSTPETKTTSSTFTWLVQQSHAHREELDAWKRRVAEMERLFVNRQEQLKRQHVTGPSEDEVPDDTLARLSSRIQQLEAAENATKTDVFMAKERMEQIDKHFQHISVRCIPSEKVEDRVTRSIANLADQVTVRCIPSDKVDELDERLTRSIANLTEQLQQQFRAREDASTTTGLVTNAAVERLELLINQSRKDLEAQLVAQRNYVDTQLQVCSGEMHQHVKDIETATTRRVADDKYVMTQKYEGLSRQIQAGGPSTSVPSGHVSIGSLTARFDILKEEVNQNVTKQWNN